jgi:LacI family transcriptional regulator
MAEKPSRISMADVARRARLSKNAVSLALRNDPQIPEATRARVARLAREMGYRKDPVVSELMARLRQGGGAANRLNLALVNANEDELAFRRHPTIPTYVEGCRRRTDHLGASLDTFWLHEPGRTARGFIRLLRTRGIRGLILTGMMDTNRLPAWFEPVVEEFPVVVTGVRTADPALSHCCVDHYMLTSIAMRHAIDLGYRRPALILHDRIDRLVDQRYTAGFANAQRLLPASGRCAPLYLKDHEEALTPRFARWLHKAQPDVVFTLYNVVIKWIREMGLSIPGDVGVIQLEWRAHHPEIAGMNQHNDVVGEAAVDMLIGMIHNGERGVPAFPRSTLVGATWTDGPSVSAQA